MTPQEYLETNKEIELEIKKECDKAIEELMYEYQEDRGWDSFRAYDAAKSDLEWHGSNLQILKDPLHDMHWEVFTEYDEYAYDNKIEPRKELTKIIFINFAEQKIMEVCNG